jgi:hypothetical protein
MTLKDTIVSRSGIFGELLYFLWHRKLWWLIPIVVMLVILGSLMILGGASGLAPFIYSLF